MFFAGGTAVEVSFLKSVVHGFGAGAGFMLAMLLMSGIRERLELADVPESFKGAAVAFVTAGIMSMAFFGFAGMVQ
jgi:electron transport complex protein RnfA